MAVIQDLPPELLDYIIELSTQQSDAWTRKDGVARALPLVARDWVEAGLRTRFRNIMAIRDVQIDPLYKVIEARRRRTTQQLRIHQLRVGGVDGNRLRRLFEMRMIVVERLMVNHARGDFPWDAVHFVST